MKKIKAENITRKSFRYSSQSVSIDLQVRVDQPNELEESIEILKKAIVDFREELEKIKK